MRNEQPREYVGMDISEGHLDVHLLPEGLASRFTNDPGGIGRLLAWLGTRSVALVVVEATGGIERRLVSGLQAASLAVAVVNPRQIRDFARATACWPRPIGSTRGCSRCSPSACGRGLHSPVAPPRRG